MTRTDGDDDLRGRHLREADLSDTTLEDSRLDGVRFTRSSMHRAAFEHLSLEGARFEDVLLEGATFREVDIVGARMDGVNLTGTAITGDVEGVTVNGVEIAPLVEAELDRRHPERPLLRAADIETLREGWAWLEAAWAGTTDAALRHPEASLRLHVDGEWSFLQTLRHLVFATDSWLGVAVLGRTGYHPLGLAGSWLDPATCGLDTAADPSVAEVLEARAASVALVRDWLDTATDADLDAVRTPPPGTGWPPPHARTARACLHVITNEEWWHRQFVLRDMARWPSVPDAGP